MDARDRFRAYAAAQLLLVAALAGIVGTLALFPPFGGHARLATEPSGLAAVAATWLLRGLVVTVGLLYVTMPVAVAGYRVSRGGRSITEFGWATIALVGLPAALLSPMLFDTYDEVLHAASLEAVGVLALGVAAVTYGAVTDDGDESHRPSPATVANVGLVAVVVLVSVLTAAVAGGAASGLADRSYRGNPQVAFATEYDAVGDDRGVLTIRHDGGVAIAAEDLIIHGEGITAVEGANQTSVGPWQGGATGADYWDGSTPAVQRGDAVTVGVEGDCVVRVVFGYSMRALEEYECGPSESAAEA